MKTFIIIIKYKVEMPQMNQDLKYQNYKEIFRGCFFSFDDAFSFAVNLKDQFPNSEIYSIGEQNV